jgi:hypothetical protein
LINNENYVTFEPYERFGSIIKEFKRKIRKNKQEPVYCWVQLIIVESSTLAIKIRRYTCVVIRKHGNVWLARLYWNGTIRSNETIETFLSIITLEQDDTSSTI